MKVRTGTAIALSLLVLQSLVAQDRAPQKDSIRKEDLRADLFFLAHDLTEGRLVGTRGYALAAEFVKSRFERLGLHARRPSGSYFHAVQPDGGDARQREYAGDRRRPASIAAAAAGQDYYPHRFGASGRVTGGLVFAGFGITAPSLSYDDYAAAT